MVLKDVTSATDEAAMWDAAPAARLRVAVAMLASILWLCSGAAAESAAETETKRAASPIWAAELTNGEAKGLTVLKAYELRRAGVTAVIIDRSRLDRRSREQAQYLAEMLKLLVIDVSDRRAVRRCNLSFARAGKSACALVASSVKQGIALARLPGTHLIIVRVKSADEVRRLTTVRSRGRFIALARLGVRDGLSLTDWQTAARMAGSGAGLHLGVAAGTPAATVSRYFGSLAKVSTGTTGSPPTSGSASPTPAAPAATPPASGSASPTPARRRPPPPASGNSVVANLFIDSDGGTCTRSSSPAVYSDAASCASMTAAYQAASLGDSVYIKAGTYGAQTIASAVSKGSPDSDLADITFRAAPGEAVTFSDIIFAVAHITLADVTTGSISARYRPEGSDRAGDIHYDNITAPGLISFHDTWYFSITNSDIGGNTDGIDGIDVYGSPSGKGCQGHCPAFGLIEGNLIHDLRLPLGSGAHIDGLQFAAGNDIVVRGNRFYHIEHQDILMSTDAGPVYNNTIENNFLGATYNPGFTLMIGTNGVRCDGHIVRYNSVVGAFNSRQDPVQQCSGAVYGNIFSFMPAFSCNFWLATWKVHHNVTEFGAACGASSYLVPDGDVGYVSRGTGDLRLLAGSEAIGRGDPANYPSFGIDGTNRHLGSAPDAGAHEKG